MKRGGFYAVPREVIIDAWDCVDTEYRRGKLTWHDWIALCGVIDEVAKRRVAS